MTNLERFSSQGKLKTLKILKCILVSIYFLVAKYFLCIFLEVHAKFGILPRGAPFPEFREGSQPLGYVDRGFLI
jgi:hypothetical protein